MFHYCSDQQTHSAKPMYHSKPIKHHSAPSAKHSIGTGCPFAAPHCAHEKSQAPRGALGLLLYTAACCTDLPYYTVVGVRRHRGGWLASHMT